MVDGGSLEQFLAAMFVAIISFSVLYYARVQVIESVSGFVKLGWLSIFFATLLIFAFHATEALEIGGIKLLPKMDEIRWR